MPTRLTELVVISEHLDILRRGPRQWNRWRAENPSLVPELTGIALSLGERQMGPINGGPINLAHAALSHASLRSATLIAANLEGADLTDADLSDARLNGANLSGANLSEALLERVDFADANLANANLSGACLTGALNLTQEQIETARGDSSTQLPPELTQPDAWTGKQSDAAVHPGRHTLVEQRSGARSARDAVSWLVGGPRVSMRPANANLPQDTPQDA